MKTECPMYYIYCLQNNLCHPCEVCGTAEGFVNNECKECLGCLLEELEAYIGEEKEEEEVETHEYPRH